MLETIYIVLAVIVFFGNKKENVGLFKALVRAIFWPVAVVLASLHYLYVAFKLDDRSEKMGVSDYLAEIDEEIDKQSKNGQELENHEDDYAHYARMKNDKPPAKDVSDEDIEEILRKGGRIKSKRKEMSIKDNLTEHALAFGAKIYQKQLISKFRNAKALSGTPEIEGVESLSDDQIISIWAHTSKALKDYQIFEGKEQVITKELTECIARDRMIACINGDIGDFQEFYKMLRDHGFRSVLIKGRFYNGLKS